MTTTTEDEDGKPSVGRSETCLTPQIPRVPYIIAEMARAAF